MSRDTDYLGRRMACDAATVEALLIVVSRTLDGYPTVDVVAVMETMIADIVFGAAKDRDDSHVAIDRIADDIKKYLTSRYASRDQRKDQVGHA